MKKSNRGKAVPLESSLSMRFRSALTSKFPDCFCYKIPDTFGIGGQRPFDAIAIIHGYTWCLEFKRGKTRNATAYQQFHLDQASRNGALSRLVNESNWHQILEEICRIVNGG